MLHMPVKANAPGFLLGGETQGGDTAGSLSSASTRQYTPAPPAAQVVIYADGLTEPTNPGGWGCWGWVATDGTGNEIASGRGCGPWRRHTNNLSEYHRRLAGHRLGAGPWAARHPAARRQPAGGRADRRPLGLQRRAPTPAARRAAHPSGRPRGPDRVDPASQNAHADALSRLAYPEARKRATR